MTPGPLQIRRAKAEQLHASLVAALAVLTDEDEIVVVPAAGDMTVQTFRKHCLARHRGPQSLQEHAADHSTDPDLDHVHKISTALKEY